VTSTFIRRQATKLGQFVYSEEVLRVANRLSVLVLVAALVVGNLGVCAAWPASDSQPMDCHHPPSCAMHAPGAPGQHAKGVAPQAPDDACCGVSEPARTDPATPVSLSTSSVSLDHTELPFLTSAFATRFALTNATARPPSHGGRRYLLLSVLLV
jgi:hypothetical protein